ncbi:MAG: S-layer homology domain-containing protein [Clostridia bacterium]|nr:S-layer homology domain-containing protein [Clostridia bacterium]
MKKRLASFILCIVMLIGVIPGVMISAEQIESNRQGKTQSVSNYEELISALCDEVVTSILITDDIDIPADNDFSSLEIRKSVTVASGKTLNVKAYNSEEKFGIDYNDLIICDGGSLTLEDNAVLKNECFQSESEEENYLYFGRVSVRFGGSLNAENGIIDEKCVINYEYGENGSDSDALILGNNKPEYVQFTVNNESQLVYALKDIKCTTVAWPERSIEIKNDLSVTKTVFIGDLCTLEVPEGVTLTIEESGTVQVNGLIYVNGTLNNKGCILNHNRIEISKGTLNNKGNIEGLVNGEFDEQPTYSSSVALLDGATVNNFIGEEIGTLNDNISVTDNIYGDSSDVKCSWNYLSGDSTFSRVHKNGYDNHNFNVVAYVFDSELIQSTIDEEEYRADNNENCVRRYGIVIPQGKSAEDNIVEIGGITVPKGTSLILEAYYDGGEGGYDNKFIIGQNKTLTLCRDSVLECYGEGELTVAGELNNLGAFISFGQFTVYGENFINNLSDLYKALSNGGSYILLPFNLDNEEFFSNVTLEGGVTVNKNTELICYSNDLFIIPGLTVEKDAKLTLKYMEVVLSQDSTVNGTLELSGRHSLLLRTPDDAQEEEKTELTISDGGLLVIGENCWVGGDSERFLLVNNGVIENFGGFERSEEHFSGNEPIEYANLRDVVCRLYDRFNGYDNMAELVLDAEDIMGSVDLQPALSYPDVREHMVNNEEPDMSDFEGLTAFSWFIKNGIVPEYDGNPENSLNPYGLITKNGIAEIINRLGNKIAGTEGKSYTDIEGYEYVQRNWIYLPEEDRYTDELSIIADDLQKLLPLPTVDSVVTLKVRRVYDEDNYFYEEVEGYNGNTVRNRHFTKPVVIECVTEKTDDYDNWGGMVFFDNCIFDDKIIVIYNEDFNSGVEFNTNCEFEEDAAVCVIKKEGAKLFNNSRIELRGLPENAEVLALAPTDVTYADRSFYLNGLPIKGGASIGFDCEADHGDADFWTIDHNQCDSSFAVMRLDIYSGSSVEIKEGESVDVSAIVQRINNSGFMVIDGTLKANEINNECWWDFYEDEEQGYYPHLVIGSIELNDSGALKLTGLNNEAYWEGEGDDHHLVGEASFSNNGSLSIDKKQPRFEISVSGKISSFSAKSDKITVSLTRYGDEKASYSSELNGNNSRYEINKVEPGLYIMKVEKDGHLSAEAYVAIICDNITRDFSLTLMQPIENTYIDVPEKSWYTEAALWCNAKGYITGTSDTTFSPSAKLTRAMFVQILAKFNGVDLNTVEYSGRFSDVEANKWYTKAVQWAVDCNITGGTGATTFSPNSPVTREQLATFFYAYCKYMDYDISASVSIDAYSDKDTVSKWALNAVKWAVAEGLISGTGPTTLSPKSYATRAQVAVIFKSFEENYVAKQG